MDVLRIHPPKKNITEYIDFINNYFIDGVDSRAENHQSQSDDVFIATYPTIGTTWMQQLCHGLRSQGDMGFDDISIVVPYLEGGEVMVPDLYGEQKGWSQMPCARLLSTVSKSILFLWFMPIMTICWLVFNCSKFDMFCQATNVFMYSRQLLWQGYGFYSSIMDCKCCNDSTYSLSSRVMTCLQLSTSLIWPTTCPTGLKPTF